MSVILRCPACDRELEIRRRHSGARLPCPADDCNGALQVPTGLDFREHYREVIRDRKGADWLTTAAFVSCFLWVAVVPAAVWFLVTRRISDARDEDRAVAPELHTARTVAITAFVAQVLWYALRFAHTQFEFGPGVAFELALDLGSILG